MTHSLRSSSVLFVLTAALAAQGLPKPAPELARLGELVGNWQGSGEMHEPGKTTKWRAEGRERWVLGGFWLQGDWQIHFEGMPEPMHNRIFRGWDPERRTYVALLVDSGGGVQFDDLSFASDGTLLQLMRRHQHGMDYAMRSTWKVDGEQLRHTVDVLMGSGPSVAMVMGSFSRVDAETELALPSKAQPGHEPGPVLQRLAAMAGAYSVKGKAVPAPGAPAIEVTGRDVYTPLFGGSAMHCLSEGEAPGAGKFVMECYYGVDERSQQIVLGYVGSMGEGGVFVGGFAADGKALTAARSGTMGGQVMASRSVLGLDANGRPASVSVHTLLGTGAPIESYSATYTPVPR